MIVFGIDPGKDGYVCRLATDTGPEFWPTPTVRIGKGKSQKRDYDVAGMRSILTRLPVSAIGVVVLEKQQSMPGQGVSSTFSTGYGFGLWHGLIAGLGLPIRIVHAQTWQALLCRDIPGDDTKGRSILAAGRLYPTIDLRATERCRVAHDGKADALLLAHYGTLTGGEPF
jgi:hypothetical protein